MILFFIATAALFFIPYSFSSTAIPAEGRDFYIFIINGDNRHKELDQFVAPCLNDQINCPSKGYIKKNI